MTDLFVVELGTNALRTTIYLAGPLLIAAMAIGILVSVFQAITQINEATLTFIPKMIAVVIVLMILAPWMIKVAEEYAGSIFANLGDWVR